MNRAKLALLAGTSLCLGCGLSQAADLPVKARPAPVPVVDPWVGWYFGGNVGYSWGRSNTTAVVGPALEKDATTYFAPGGTSTIGSKVNGVIGGVQLGYIGRIAPSWLGGVEADFQWSGQKGSARGEFSSRSDDCTTGDCTFANAHDVTTKLRWFGTLRGSVGPEVNGIWFYGTGGFAYGEVSVSGVNTLTIADANPPHDVVAVLSTPYSYSQFKGGWTAGAGATGLIGDGRLRWKIEYIHLDLGNINGGIFGTFPRVQVNTTRFTDDILRVGLNYRFSDPKTVVANNMPVNAAPLPLLGWTGWYAGLNAGYIDSVGRTNTDATVLVPSDDPSTAIILADTARNQFQSDRGGFLGGGQVGYNYQFSPSFVAGLEADIQGSTLRQDFQNTVSAITRGVGIWVTTTTVSNRLDYLGTVRGRVGVTPTPDVLLYATGGLAYGGVRSDTQIDFESAGGVAPVPGTTSGSISKTRFGWTAGGGVEWMFARNWSAKLEYLYYDLGSVSYSTGGYSTDVSQTGFTGNGIVSIATNTTTRMEGNIGRFGLNYKFGGGSY